jgi:hypothetical protein
MDLGGWMWLIIDVLLVAVLGGAIVYGIVMWRRRYRDPTTQRIRDEATREAYREK